MRRARLGPALLTVVLGAGLLAACGDDPEAPCQAVTATLDRAEPAPEENRRFDVRGPGWVAGDSAYSVALPDGRTAWLFSDSFVGSVNRWDVPRAGMAMVHNALVVEGADGRLTTRTSELFDEPHAYVRDPSASEYYWVQDGLVERGELLVFLSRTRQVPSEGDDGAGTGGHDGFAWVGTAIARVSLPDLRVVDVTPTASTGGIAWGAAVLEGRDSTYVYGVEDEAGEGKFLHLAKSPRGAVTDRSRWQYWTGTGWGTDDAATARLTGRVANELSVTPFGDGYLMISHDSGGIYSPTINAWTACTPSGPWRDPQPIYTTPETGRGELFTYNAHAHPELSEAGELLVSYNVNTFDFAELTAHPTLYRPRFVSLEVD